MNEIGSNIQICRFIQKYVLLSSNVDGLFENLPKQWMTPRIEAYFYRLLMNSGSTVHMQIDGLIPQF